MLEMLIAAFICIPIALYYILKWTVIVVAHIVIAMIQVFSHDSPKTEEKKNH